MGSRLLFAAALLLLPSTGQAQSRRSDEPLEARPRSSPSEDGSGLGALATAGIVLDVLSIAPLVLFGTSVVFFDEINSTYMNDPIVQLYQSILPPGADPCAQSVAPARVQDLCREAKSWSIIGTMSLVVGGAALLGGTALLIVGLATGGDGDGERAILVPSFGPGYGGLSLAGRL